MTVTDQLEQIYTRYEAKLAKARAKAGAFAGAFNLGDDPRKHPCNEMFYEELEEWTDAFAPTASEKEAGEAAVYILSYAGKHRDNETYWYTYAAQKHAAKLIPMMTVEDAEAVSQSFESLYPKLDRTPVQNEIAKLLAEKTGKKELKAKEQNGMLKMWAKRVVALLVGLTIAHLGVTLFLLADLGSDPFNVLVQGLFRTMPLGGAITHGTVHVAVSLLIILILLVVDRSYVRIGTFLCMILGGPIIDMFTLILQGILNSNSVMAIRLVGVVAGCVILAFGMTIVIKSQAGTGPNDLVAVVISDKIKRKFGIIRIIVDICFAGTGFLLGGTVGIGTIICLAVVGPVAQVFMPFSQRICDKILE